MRNNSPNQGLEMGQKRKWSASEKFKIALLAIKNETTINDICKQYEVAPCLSGSPVEKEAA